VTALKLASLKIIYLKLRLINMHNCSISPTAFYLMLTMLDVTIICSHLTFDKQQGWFHERQVECTLDCERKKADSIIKSLLHLSHKLPCATRRMCACLHKRAFAPAVIMASTRGHSCGWEPVTQSILGAIPIDTLGALSEIMHYRSYARTTHRVSRETATEKVGR